MRNIGFKGMHGITEDLSTNDPPSNCYSGELLATKLRITSGISGVRWVLEVGVKVKEAVEGLTHIPIGGTLNLI